jgi:lipoprotein-anchoring transpeptidase ErfK/SrfK
MTARSKLSVNQLIEYGILLINDGQPQAASNFFNKALERDPHNVTALLWLAGLCDEGEQSLRYLVRALEIEPRNDRAHAAIRWARRRVKPAPFEADDTQPTPPVARPPIEAAPIEPPQPDRAAPNSAGGHRGAALLLGLIALFGVIGGAVAAVWLFSQPGRASASAIAQVTAPAASLPPATPTLPPIVTATSTALPEPTETTTPLPTETPQPTPTPEPPTPVPYVDPPPAQPVGDNTRWIDVDLTHQWLVAYEGDAAVYSSAVSTGLPGSPTVTGQYHIYVKYDSQLMYGPGYYLPDVPWVMYFYEGYGLHGTYWHNNFGHPMSHGCVNLPTPAAKWLYDWASVGTLVNIHY